MSPRVLIFIAAIVSLPGALQSKSSDPVFDQIHSIVETLSSITGLSEKHSVPYGRMSKQQLNRFLNKRIRKTIKPTEIQADELALKMFGLVPQNFNLRQSTIALLTEQAAAFYDYDSKKLFLLEGSPINEQTTVLAHELAHALADQYFHLDKFMDDTPLNDDEDLARTAVVEGQASWLMIAYDLKQAGQPPIPTPGMLSSANQSDASSLNDYPVLKAAPLYIRDSLLFPYSEGTLFFDAVYRKMGKPAFRYVFTHPPTDTAQIIHPQRYFAHTEATVPALPDFSLTDEKKKITDGSLGEFDHQVLLHQYLGKTQANKIAPHLRGGDFAIVAVGKHRKPVLEYISQWDSSAEAAAFFDCYQQILRKKWRRCDIAVSEDSLFAGTGDDGYFVVHLSGDEVWSVEGINNIDDWHSLQQSPPALTKDNAVRSR